MPDGSINVKITAEVGFLSGDKDRSGAAEGRRLSIG
jgi:hypothetical protein